MKTVSVIQRKRDPYVAEWTKRRANGICQLCLNQAPFKDRLLFLLQKSTDICSIYQFVNTYFKVFSVHKKFTFYFAENSQNLIDFCRFLSIIITAILRVSRIKEENHHAFRVQIYKL